MIFREDIPGASARTRVKICGITHPEDAVLAVELGADALGLNFYPKSPRCLQAEQDGDWLRELPRGVSRVAVVVNASREEIVRLLDAALVDAVQLHGDEDAAFCQILRDEGVPFIKAIRARDGAALRDAERFGTPFLLMDAFHPNAYGGTGQAVDWTLAAEFAARHPQAILAGGLRPENVAEAIGVVGPHAVDVASGIERNGEPRRKDAEKMREFFANLRAVDAQKAQKSRF